MIFIYLIIGLALVFIGYMYMYKIYEDVYNFEKYLDEINLLEFKKYYNERYKVYLFSLIYSSIVSYFFYLYLLERRCETKFVIIPYLALFVFIQIFILTIFQYKQHLTNFLDNKELLIRWNAISNNILLYFIMGNIFSLIGYGFITFYIIKINIIQMIFRSS